MFSRLVYALLSDYHRMVLATIGPWRFLSKLPNLIFRFGRCLKFKIFTPQRWSSTLFLNDDRPSMLSGRWLFGSCASLDLPQFVKERQKVMARAEKARLGIFEVNGQRIDLNCSPHFGRWDVDPISGQRWPQKPFSAKLCEMPGDIRFPWELNRLHQLVWFGQAWRYTRNKEWPDQGVNQLEQILSEAPFEYGIHWRDGLQLAVRIYSLVAFADLCHDAPRNIHLHLNNAIAAHAYVLARQISPHSEITNNHVIGETCALALAGIYLQRQDYLHSSLCRLRLELKRQIYPDGVPYEGSVPYIRFDLDFLTLLALALKASHSEIPFWLKDAIALIGGALAGLVDAKGRVPPIGDGDEARVIRFDEESYLTVNESLHVASKVVGVSFAPAKPTDSFALWVVGLDLPPTKLPCQNRYLPYSGLVHLNRGELDVWLDCGPTGYGLNGPGGHGHNDTSAIVVHLSGCGLLHDPGWFTYYGDRQMRDQLRSTGAHNTIRIEGQEQARLGGVFEIRNECKPTGVRIREFGTATAISCGHTGYSRLDKSISYRRLIVVDGTGPWRIRLTDRIRSRVPVKVESHLGSDLTWSTLNHREWFLPGGHFLRTRSDHKKMRVVNVPYSRKTGELMQGTALEWTIPPAASTGSEISYISRWELHIFPIL